MSFRGSMPPGQPFHGQPQQQQNSHGYMQYPSQQQGQNGQHFQHAGAQRFAVDGGAGAVGYQQFYDGQSTQYMQQHQQQQQPQAQHTMHSNGYAQQEMSQFPGYEAIGYNPYVQQPAAAQYMPPPNVWQQPHQPQQQQSPHQSHHPQVQQNHQQHHLQQQQMQQMNQQRMAAAVRASPVHGFDQLPPQQPQTHQTQHHAQHYQPSPHQQQQPLPQQHAQFHQPSPSPSPSPRFPSQMVPTPSHQSMSSPHIQHIPQPQQHAASIQYRQSPSQPSPKTVPAPRPKKKTPAPSSRQASVSHPTPPPPQQPALTPTSNGESHHSAPRETPVYPPQPIQSTVPPPPAKVLPQPEPVPEPETEPEILAPPEPPTLQQEPSFESFQFVNLQDIQQLPPLPPLPFDDFSSISRPEPVEKRDVPPTPEPMSIDIQPSTEDAREQIIVKPKQEPNDTVQIKASPQSSVAPSPALSQRSLGSISKKSPAMSNKARPGQSTSMLIAVAEEMLAKARASVHDIAMSLQPERLEEYQTMVSVSVGCLESALHTGRLTPRQEARLRLRYATVLHEETENVMECETTLSKAITLCDNHRLHDLKYCSQYLQLRVLFHRNRRAALRALDNHISDCETFKHVNWYYAFRLLKASLCMEAGTSSDASALDNLRALQTAAASRGDNALSVFASLLEGLTFLKAAKEGANEKVQACLAQVAKYQLDESVNIPQIEILTLLLDVASNLHTAQPEVTAEKLRKLQKRFDECAQWGEVNSEFLISIRKSSTSAKTVSVDTSMVLRYDEHDTGSDYLVVTFMTKAELSSLVFVIAGLVNFLRPDKDGQKTTGPWQEGLKVLEGWDTTTAGISYGAPVSLPVAIRQRQWRLDAQSYLNTVLGLTAASRCQWDTVKQHLSKLAQLSASAGQTTLDQFALYLQGVYLQGTGDLPGALSVYQAPIFQLPTGTIGPQSAKCELSLLAGLNRLWIMQHPTCRNDEITLQLVEELRPICSSHPHLNLRSTWQTVMAALVTDPPQSLAHRKHNMYAAMQGAKTASNMLLSAIGLCIMRHHFFEDIVGEQALKSARAAAKQAQRSGNTLWESVADGMLAHSYETAGAREEARMEHDQGAAKAASAFARSY